MFQITYKLIFFIVIFIPVMNCETLPLAKGEVVSLFEINDIDKEVQNSSKFIFKMNGFKKTKVYYEIIFSKIMIGSNGTKQCGLKTRIKRFYSEEDEVSLILPDGEYCGSFSFYYYNIRSFRFSDHGFLKLEFSVKEEDSLLNRKSKEKCSEDSTEINTFHCPSLLTNEEKIFTFNLTNESDFDFLRTTGIWYVAIMTGTGTAPYFSILAPLLGIAVINPEIEVSTSR